MGGGLWWFGLLLLLLLLLLGLLVEELSSLPPFWFLDLASVAEELEWSDLGPLSFALAPLLVLLALTSLEVGLELEAEGEAFPPLTLEGVCGDDDDVAVVVRCPDDAFRRSTK